MSFLAILPSTMPINVITPPTQKMYLSRHVIFHELIFPFQSNFYTSLSPPTLNSKNSTHNNHSLSLIILLSFSILTTLLILHLLLKIQTLPYPLPLLSHPPHLPPLYLLNLFNPPQVPLWDHHLLPLKHQHRPPCLHLLG